MLSRRVFLKGMMAGVATVTAGQSLADSFAPCMLDMQRGRERYLIDLRTDEGLRAAAWLLRDIRAGNVVGKPNYDTLRLAAWAQAELAARGSYAVFDLHSGLRINGTNKTTEGAAKDSRHKPDALMRFSAIDLSPIGIDKNYFGDLISKPRFGGVGWYKTHIHFDVRDRPAYWRRGV